MRSSTPLIVLALLASGCSDETKITLLIDSDLAPGVDIDSLEIAMWDDGAQTWSRERVLSAGDTLPLSLSVAPTSGGAESVELTVDAVRQGRSILVARRSASFVYGRTIEVQVCLWRDCVGSDRPSCLEGRCDRPAGDGDADADADGGDGGGGDAQADAGTDAEARGDAEADVLLDAEILADADGDASRPRWIREVGGLGRDEVGEVAVGPDGSVYGIGTFQGGDIDPDPDVNDEVAGIGQYNFFVFRLDREGSTLWTRGFSDSGADWAHGIAVNEDGAVFLAGSFETELDFDPSGATEMRTPTAGRDAFVLCLDASGDFQWVVTLGGAGNDDARDVGVAGDGSIVVAGSFEETIDLDPGDGADERTASASADAFVIRLDSSGAYLWGRTIGGGQYDQAWSVETDADGGSLVAGRFSGTVDLDPGAGTNEHTASGGAVFVLRLSEAGDSLWGISIGGEGDIFPAALARTADGSSVVTGHFYGGPIDFDPGVGVDERSSRGSADAWVMRLSGDGAAEWAVTIGAGDTDWGYDAALLEDGTVVTTGYFGNIVDFDPGEASLERRSEGLSDVYALHLGSDGSFLDVVTFGGDDGDEGHCVAPAGGSGIFLGGQYEGAVDFDPGEEVDELIARGSLSDGFIGLFSFER